MKTYKVKIKNSKRAETIKTSSELEAKVKYCEKKGFKYRHFAGKLEVINETGQRRRDNK